MNFKPTLWKSIASVIGGLIMGFLSMKIFARPGSCGPDPSNPGMQICVDFAPPTEIALIFLIVSLVLIYLIWSLASAEK